MATSEMTLKQRTAVAALEAARAAGMSLVDYARANELVVRELYDAIAALRRRGALSPAAASRPRAPTRARDRFLPVRIVSAEPVATATAPRGVAMCRLVHPSGIALECAQWPPVEWLSAVWSGRGDAAT
jgi:hypothetical protein